MCQIIIGREGKETEKHFASAHDAVRWCAPQIAADQIATRAIVSGGKVVMTAHQVFQAATAFHRAHRDGMADRDSRRDAMRDWQRWCAFMRSI